MQIRRTHSCLPNIILPIELYEFLLTKLFVLDYLLLSCASFRGVNVHTPVLDMLSVAPVAVHIAPITNIVLSMFGVDKALI